MKKTESEQIAKWTRNIKKLYLFQFLANFHLISGVLIPFFMTWGQLTFFEVMCLESYFTIMILVFEIPCGAISDYINRKFSIILAGISVSIAVLIYSSYPNIILFVLGETFWALSAALISGTDQALIYDSLKKVGKEEKINKKMATLNSSMLIGIAVSAPLGSMISQLFSIPFVMFIMVVPFSLATIIAFTLKEPNETIIKTKEKKYTEIIVLGFNELKEKKELRILGFESIYVEVLIFFILWMYQPYLEQLQISLAWFGFVSTGMTLSQVLLTNLVPKLEKNFQNRKNLIRIYTLIPALGYILMGLFQIPALSIILILIVIGFGFSRKIFFIEAINAQIKSKERATVLSTINMFSSLLRAIFYPLVGLFVMWSLNYTFIALGILVLIDSIGLRIKNEYFKLEEVSSVSKF
ncbi:MAG: MFS transporter [Promethearchaeota archaeon]|nr:MAG: MFS transporter [Candidatus Lokiarchaeota archaeon]